ncbi:MAG TPA: MFS transporter [Beutenbergiaceae bacterium]|nr:MFS transporter [Beutenbergiaceae bacterium]
MTTKASPPGAGVRGAMIAVFAVFFAAGFVFSSWASRIPTVQSELGLNPGQMGMLLLVGSLGSIISLPLAGRLVGRFGARRTVGTSVLAIAVSLASAVAFVFAGNPFLTGAMLLLALAGVGAMDVAMNFEGTLVEQRLGRAIMPHFHGCFSLGTIAGAGVGTLLSRAGVPITTHVWSAIVAVVVITAVSLAFFFPDDAHTEGGPRTEPDGADGEARAGEGANPPGGKRGAGSYGRAWFEPRTLMVGLIVMAASLTEGAANDWLALGIREGFEVPEHQGAFGLTLFVTAMTVMRFTGTWLLNRFGRVAVLRLCTGLAIMGLAIFGLSPSLPVAMVGAVLWGLGAALGFPVGMSAASDEPLHAAARLSVVSTIGYGAFLIGPPLLGLLADHVGYRHALLAIIVPLLAGLAVMRQAAPPGPVHARAE